MKNTVGVLDQIKWIGDHLSYYGGGGEKISEESKKILRDIEKYSQNVYTYPTEAAQAYRQFQEHFCNNPYRYLSSYREKGEAESIIFCNHLEGYFISDDPSSQCPAAVLTASMETQEARKLYDDFLQRELRQYQQKVLKSLKKEVLDVDQEVDDLLSLWLDAPKTTKGYIAVGALLLFLISVCAILLIAPQLFTGRWLFLVTLLLIVLFLTAGGGFLWQSVKNYRLLKYCNTLKKIHDPFRDQFQDFISQKCTVGYLLTAKKGVISPAEIDWETYETEKQFLQRVPVRKRRKLRVIAANTIGLLACVLGAELVSTYALFWKTDVVERKVQEANAVEWCKVIYRNVYQNIDMDALLQAEQEEMSSGTGFNEEGFLFADSDARFLTADEVYSLQENEEYDFKTLLGFARNEIYARKGYPFKEGGTYYNFYMQYDWYSGQEHRDVTEEMINEYERANINLIVRIEQEEGYR